MIAEVCVCVCVCMCVVCMYIHVCVATCMYQILCVLVSHLTNVHVCHPVR